MHRRTEGEVVQNIQCDTKRRTCCTIHLSMINKKGYVTAFFFFRSCILHRVERVVELRKIPIIRKQSNEMNKENWKLVSITVAAWLNVKFVISPC